jgi:hypothetical protein
MCVPVVDWSPVRAGASALPLVHWWAACRIADMICVQCTVHLWPRIRTVRHLPIVGPYSS